MVVSGFDGVFEENYFKVNVDIVIFLITLGHREITCDNHKISQQAIRSVFANALRNI